MKRATMGPNQLKQHLNLTLNTGNLGEKERNKASRQSDDLALALDNIKTPTGMRGSFNAGNMRPQTSKMTGNKNSNLSINQSPATMTPLSSRKRQDKSDLTPQSLNFGGLVAGGPPKSPQGKSMIGEGLKSAVSQSQIKPPGTSKIGGGNIKRTTTPKKDKSN